MAATTAKQAKMRAGLSPKEDTFPKKQEQVVTHGGKLTEERVNEAFAAKFNRMKAKQVPIHDRYPHEAKVVPRQHEATSERVF